MTLREKPKSVTPSAKTVTQPSQSVTAPSVTPRARTPSYGGKKVTVTRNASVTQSVTRQGALKHAPSRNETPKRPVTGTSTWMHLAAMNLIDDHQAGAKVDARKLAAACELLGLDPATLRARISEGGAL